MTPDTFRRLHHADLSLQQVADRLPILDLVEACAQCADRRDAIGQTALFAENTDFAVYMDSRNPSPTQRLPAELSAHRYSMNSTPAKPPPRRSSP